MLKSKGSYSQKRTAMVKEQLEGRGITDKRVLAAMSKVPREEFVPEDLRGQAYFDGPLPIGQGQTISQPYVIALSCQLLELKGKEKVLDVGAGSGYEAAVLSLLVDKVIGIEIKPQLAQEAGEKLKKLGYGNVEIITGDARAGYKPESPYDAIKSAAFSEDVPKVWKEQLGDGGRIVLPLRKGLGQKLVRVTKKDGKFKTEPFIAVAYVPLISSG